MQAVIRETKEELDLDLEENDLKFIGIWTSRGENNVIGYMHMHKTGQEEFTVLEGQGAHWMSLEKAREYMSDSHDDFESIVEMIKDNM